MKELILELFSEEIPAIMQADAEKAYKNIFSKYFTDQGILFSSLDSYSGPRRIVIHAVGLEKDSKGTKLEEIRGPKINAPEQALQGFCRANGVDFSELTVKALANGVEYYFLQKQTADISLNELLSRDLPELISSYTWPKSMCWGDYKIKWVRPLRNILCILGGQVVDFSFGHLKSNNRSFGHRFMSLDQHFAVKDFAGYKQDLAKNYVILAATERQSIIWNKAHNLSFELGLVIKPDHKLLEEVAGLVEYPCILIGKIDHKFLKVPSEILISSMRKNQKYFSLLTKNGEFAPYFIFASNILSSDPAEVVSGNEKVLSARLSDALYFYERDLEIGINQRNKALNSVIFHAKLGTLAEKVERIESILATLLPQDKLLARAARDCKNDIASEVVGEFPDLQGVMGYYYATQEGLSEDYAVAIKEHYQDDNFSNKFAAYLALADKIDTLCGLTLAGEKATGSKDPYALRRQALGVIRIMEFLNMEASHQSMLHNITISDLINIGINNYPDAIRGLFPDAHSAVLEFIKERLRHYLRDRYSNYSVANDAGAPAPGQYNIIDAVLSAHYNNAPFAMIMEKLTTLDEFLQNSEGQSLLASYKRINNILASEATKNNRNSLEVSGGAVPAIVAELLELSAEQKLYEAFVQLEDFDGSDVKLLTSLCGPLDDFFEHVLVNSDQENIKANRHALLSNIKALFMMIADFDKI